jgi:protein-S-isoprenylcysteine O-methyltransferase Ste14
MKTLFLACRAILYGGAFVWFWLTLALGLGGSAESAAGSSAWPRYSAAVGIGLMLAGGSLALFCVVLFVVRGRGTPAPFDAPRCFVAVGPYRYVRNPMYWGGGAALAGLGLYQHSFPILVFCAGWFLLFHVFVVYYEEPTLRQKFGAAYQDYCRVVHRWAPGPGLGRHPASPASAGHA